MSNTTTTRGTWKKGYSGRWNYNLGRETLTLKCSGEVLDLGPKNVAWVISDEEHGGWSVWVLRSPGGKSERGELCEWYEKLRDAKRWAETVAEQEAS